MNLRRNLWSLSFRANAADEEAIAEQLLALTGSYPAIHQRPRTRSIRVESYLRTRETVNRARKALARFAPSIRPIRHEDWAESWKKHFHAHRVGKRIIIKPSWESCKLRTGDVVIELDPGLSFGTGQHPTTCFCLRAIERLASPRCSSFLDVGTGSGILAIAAAKLGYRPVSALDNDPQAVRVAKQNARANAVRFPIRAGALERVATATRFDVVVANLLADIILCERRALKALVAPGGFLILAGILVKESPEVGAAFRSMGMKTVAVERTRHWAGFVFRKPGTRAGQFLAKE